MGLLLRSPLVDRRRSRPPTPTRGASTLSCSHENRSIRSEESANIKRLVFLVGLVCFVHLVGFVHQTNETNQTNQMSQIDQTNHKSACRLLDFCWRGYLFVDRMATNAIIRGTATCLKISAKICSCSVAPSLASSRRS